MSLKVALSAFALLAGGCASAAPAEDACSVEIDFGSYCCGVDGETKAAVERYLATARGAARSTARPWGREGESTLCVAARTTADADRIFRDVSAMIPPVARTGPVRVTAADGRASPLQRQK